MINDVYWTGRAYLICHNHIKGMQVNNIEAAKHFSILILMMGINKLTWKSDPQTILSCFLDWRESTVMNSTVINLIEDRLQIIKKTITSYSFDPAFYRPPGEPDNITRRKRLCRLRVHRKGNDMTENEETYEWYPIEYMLQFLYDNYQAGNYELTGRVPVSQRKL